MTAPHPYSVTTAREAADRGELGAWVAEFLASPGSDNPVLAEMLAASADSWLGPVQLPLDQLNRLAGPPGSPSLVQVEEHEWRDDVDDLTDRIEEGWEPPPLIVTYREDQLVVEDGNHRIEGLRRAGEDRAWSIVNFETPADRDRFEVPDLDATR